MIEFIVEGKPVPQPRPRVFRTETGKSKAVNSSRSVTYKRLVKLTAKSEMNKRRMIIIPDPIPVAVHLNFVYSIPTSYAKKKRQSAQDGTLRYVKRPDLDNLAKAILDALNGTIYQDDSQVVELSINKEYGNTDHVSIKVKDLSGMSALNR